MFTVIVVIFAIGVFVGIATRSGEGASETTGSFNQADEVERKVSRLNERVSVLERLQTDEDYALRRRFDRFSD